MSALSAIAEVDLVTGGSGFVGANLVDRLAGLGRHVIVLDNLSRPGVEENLAWLRERHGERVEAIVGDIRDVDVLGRAVARAGRIFHFAAQVAVTTSISDPADDFSTNLVGTFNLLEAVRRQPVPPSLLFASTNKVYGKLGELGLEEGSTCYQPTDAEFRRYGVSELQPLDFQSPYGCSKGGADQYVVDYARTYGLPALVFRMSCLYGPRQFGTEDQGWVAHFLISALSGRPITIFGNGKQVRDLLFIEDVVDAFLSAQDHAHELAGNAFNIGGGPDNAASLLDVLAGIERVTGIKPDVSFDDWRLGDQAYYVSDTRKFQAMTGWRPKTDVARGLELLARWLEPRAQASRPQVANHRASPTHRASQSVPA